MTNEAKVSEMQVGYLNYLVKAYEG